MNIYLCGLGNPGQDYLQTRHNIGFLVLDEIATKLGLVFSDKSSLSACVAKKGSIVMIKPTTYMNKSGEAVAKVTNYFGVENIEDQLIVIHDDLDIEFGKFKWSRSGPKGHNGLISIENHIRTDSYWHIRVGIDDRQGDRTIPGKDYVLQKLPKDKLEVVSQLSNTIYQEIVEKMKDISS